MSASAPSIRIPVATTLNMLPHRSNKPNCQRAHPPQTAPPIRQVPTSPPPLPHLSSEHTAPLPRPRPHRAPPRRQAPAARCNPIPTPPSSPHRPKLPPATETTTTDTRAHVQRVLCHRFRVAPPVHRGEHLEGDSVGNGSASHVNLAEVPHKIVAVVVRPRGRGGKKSRGTQGGGKAGKGVRARGESEGLISIDCQKKAEETEGSL